MAEPELTAQQRGLVETWERHMAAEFDTQSIEATMATMTLDPVVNHVPVMTGGIGAREVRQFYTQYFIRRHPPDTAIVPLSRTVGQTRIVDELIYQFTHTIEMPWMLPGIAPTGRHVEVALVVVVEFLDGKDQRRAHLLGPGHRAGPARDARRGPAAGDRGRGGTQGQGSRAGTLQCFDYAGARVARVSPGPSRSGTCGLTRACSRQAGRAPGPARAAPSGGAAKGSVGLCGRRRGRLQLMRMSLGGQPQHRGG